MSALIDGRAIPVNPDLVRVYGAEEAMVVQQVHWHITAGHGEELSDGFEWTAAPYAEISAETGLKVSTIRRAIRSLETREVLHSTQPEGYTRTKWYRIDYDRIESDCPSAENRASKRGKPRQEARESAPVPSSQTSKKKRESTHSADSDFETFWGAYPRPKNKAEARRAFMRALERADATTILAGLSAQLDDFAREPKQFIPHPASWLDGERWLDAPDTADDGLFAYDTGDYGDTA